MPSGKNANAVHGNKIVTVVIGDSVTSIGIDAFSHNSLTGSLVIPDSVTSISEYAFKAAI